jgi:hypothetical protein
MGGMDCTLTITVFISPLNLKSNREKAYAAIMPITKVRATTANAMK